MNFVNPVWIVVLFNALPVISAVTFGWSVLTLLLLYWFENVVLGVINAAKMLVAGVANGNTTSMVSLVFILPFFAFHYGMFCAVHGVFLFVLFGPASGIGDNFDMADLPGRVIDVLTASPFVLWNVVLLTAFHLFVFLTDWVGKGRWRGVEPAVQMFAPYGRVVVIHITILVGAFAVLLFGQPLLAVALLAVLKTALEVGWIKFTAARESLATQSHQT
ncbi:MAG: hypothetical protein HY243_14805 [Proteobacteria bacterium]|nr:hypothetical protein [Pseudomonadota bacterium]